MVLLQKSDPVFCIIIPYIDALDFTQKNSIPLSDTHRESDIYHIHIHTNVYLHMYTHVYKYETDSSHPQHSMHIHRRIYVCVYT